MLSIICNILQKFNVFKTMKQSWNKIFKINKYLNVSSVKRFQEISISIVKYRLYSYSLACKQISVVCCQKQTNESKRRKTVSKILFIMGNFVVQLWNLSENETQYVSDIYVNLN